MALQNKRLQSTDNEHPELFTEQSSNGSSIGNSRRVLRHHPNSVLPQGRRFQAVPQPFKAEAVSAVGFVTSHLSGVRISYDMSSQLPSISTPSLPALQPIVARRICPFTGKKANRANKISFSAYKTKKLQFVNLQYKRVWWEAGKRFLKLRLSTKALKTIEKNGNDVVAKKAGIDLRKL